MIKFLIAWGLGFSPGHVKYLVTRGFGIFVIPPTSHYLINHGLGFGAPIKYVVTRGFGIGAAIVATPGFAAIQRRRRCFYPYHDRT